LVHLKAVPQVALQTHRLKLGAHWQLQLLNYLVARMENTALYVSARTGIFSVAATEKLRPVEA
jgi:hypothetical protein